MTELFQSVFLLLERIIEVLACCDAISLAPVGKELTTQQADNFLNVSRQRAALVRREKTRQCGEGW